jgi:hypothetical protein
LVTGKRPERLSRRIIGDRYQLLQLRRVMESVFDWVTMAVFAGLIVLFLQRSTEDVPRDSLWQYLVAAVGCAVTNFLGNEGLKNGDTIYMVAAVLLMIAVLGFVHFVLKPFENMKS